MIINETTRTEDPEMIRLKKLIGAKLTAINLGNDGMELVFGAVGSMKVRTNLDIFTSVTPTPTQNKTS